MLIFILSACGVTVADYLIFNWYLTRHNKSVDQLQNQIIKSHLIGFAIGFVLFWISIWLMLMGILEILPNDLSDGVQALILKVIDTSCFYVPVVVALRRSLNTPWLVTIVLSLIPFFVVFGLFPPFS